MDPHFNPAPNASDGFLTPQEQQGLRSAGITGDILARLIRAFVSALLAELPGILGGSTPAAGPGAPRTKP